MSGTCAPHAHRYLTLHATITSLFHADVSEPPAITGDGEICVLGSCTHCSLTRCTGFQGYFAQRQNVVLSSPDTTSRSVGMNHVPMYMCVLDTSDTLYT